MKILSVLIVAISLTACQQHSDSPAAPSGKVEPKTLVQYEYPEGEITSSCNAAIAKAQTRISELVQLSKGSRDFSRTILVLDQILGDANDATQKLAFMKYVSTDEKLRKEGGECEINFAKFNTEVMSNRDLYQMVERTFASNVAQAELRKVLLDGFKTNGTTLPEDKSKVYVDLKNKLSKLEADFTENLNNDKTKVSFTKAELEGLPEDFVNSFPVEDGKVVIPVRSNTYSRILEQAKNPETRKTMLHAWLNRQAEKNTKLLEEALLVRQEIAKLFGYATWADYRTSVKLSKNAKTAMDFLEDLKTKLAPKKDQDLAILLEAKKQDDPTATKLNAWDISFYEAKIKKDKYAVDPEVLREYFPKDFVIARMFEVYSQLLGVSYAEVPANVWHPSAKLYSVKDKASGKIIAYFYADLDPREGKYGHAAAFGLIYGRVMPDGYYQTPIASIVANFSPATKDRPSLLSHDEVETLFHEFGHIMHDVLTKSPYMIVSGFNTNHDFVEAPSQMLENWVWNKEILNKISGHYRDTSVKIPDATIDQMIALKGFNKGYFYMRQITLGLIDLTMHTTQGPVDTVQLHNKIYEEAIGIEAPEDNHMMATFGHMMGGYDAGYYAYLWSEVFAADMFTQFEKNGILDEDTGMSYRRNILEPGGTEDPLNLLRRFLDREPNRDAFLKTLGI